MYIYIYIYIYMYIYILDLNYSKFEYIAHHFILLQLKSSALWRLGGIVV